LSTFLSTGLSTDSTPLIHRFIHRYLYNQMLQPAWIPLSPLILSTVWKSYPQFLWISTLGCGRFPTTYPQSVIVLWIGCGQNTHSIQISCYNLLSLGEGDRDHLLLFTWWVISCIWAKTSRSLFMRLAILAVACITVEWSRPPKAFPILGSDSSVSSLERYMATCLG
jgi:hypothetical protein